MLHNNITTWLLTVIRLCWACEVCAQSLFVNNMTILTIIAHMIGNAWGQTRHNHTDNQHEGAGSKFFSTWSTCNASLSKNDIESWHTLGKDRLTEPFANIISNYTALNKEHISQSSDISTNSFTKITYNNVDLTFHELHQEMRKLFQMTSW